MKKACTTGLARTAMPYTPCMEPKPKVLIPLWQLVANYYLSSVFSIPLIGYILVSVLINLIHLPATPSAILLFLASLVTIWFGSGYGARYVQKRYVIENPAKLVKYATITMVVLQIIGILLTVGVLAFGFGLIAAATAAMALVGYAVQDVITVIVFYYASKKNLQGAPGA